jgi:hypothetical protein
MKRPLSLLLWLSLSIFTMPHLMTAPTTVAKTAQKEPTGQKADANTLLDDANMALADMIKAARADQGLDPKTPKNKAFWSSSQLIAKNLKMAKTGLFAKSDDFFKGIANAGEAEKQLKVDWKLTDSKNKAVIENRKKLGRDIALLRTNFSKEAAQRSLPVGPSASSHATHLPAASPLPRPESGYTPAGAPYMPPPPPPPKSKRFLPYKPPRP